MEESPTFISHVFNFEQESRNEMMNIMQYTVFSIIFVTLLNRLFQEYIPEVDKNKQNFALFIEITIQCILLFLGILFIHRIITFIPTFSGIKYAEQNIITVILPILILLLSTSSLGEKITIIADRLFGNFGNVKTVSKTAPVATSIAPPPIIPTNSPEPDFNSMFAGPTTPLVNASSPDSFEPMASNFGGSIF